MRHRHDQEQRRHTLQMPGVGAPCGAAEWWRAPASVCANYWALGDLHPLPTEGAAREAGVVLCA